MNDWVVSDKSLNMQQLHTMFYFRSVLLRRLAPNTITANSTQSQGSNKKLVYYYKEVLHP